MEKGKNLTSIIVLLIVITIIGATALKVYNTHIDNLYKVVEKRICEAARQCYIDKKCEGQKVKIDDLIKEKYLTNQVDPKTKEYINSDIVVTYNGASCSVDIR